MEWKLRLDVVLIMIRVRPVVACVKGPTPETFAHAVTYHFSVRTGLILLVAPYANVDAAYVSLTVPGWLFPTKGRKVCPAPLLCLPSPYPHLAPYTHVLSSPTA